MTTVENERDRVTTVRDTSVAEPPTGPMTAVPAGVRERFGGAKVGAAFFGWLVAIGMTVLLTGLVALAVAAWDRAQARCRSWPTPHRRGSRAWARPSRCSRSAT